MADLLDKAILLGMGLEKKAKEIIEELEKSGRASTSEAKGQTGGEELSAKQLLENKVVENGVHALKEFMATVKKAKDKLETELGGSSEKLLGKLNVATQDDVDIVKEMARIAREKVDRLEKRVEELETTLNRP